MHLARQRNYILSESPREVEKEGKRWGAKSSFSSTKSQSFKLQK